MSSAVYRGFAAWMIQISVVAGRFREGCRSRAASNQLASSSGILELHSHGLIICPVGSILT
jgi:hypothetical protein